jgi:hypothetical protein
MGFTVEKLIIQPTASRSLIVSLIYNLNGSFEIKAEGIVLDKVTDEEIILIQHKLNNRPRKLLGLRCYVFSSIIKRCRTGD